VSSTREQQQRASWGPERESYFAAAFAASLDAIFVIDDDRYIVDANPAAYELLHVDGPPLIGRRMDDFTPPMTDEAIAGRWATFMLKGHDQGEYELLRDDGSRLTMAYTATARVAPGRHFTILRDITERRLAEELIESQWRRLLEAQAIVGVGTWDSDALTGKVEWSSELYRTYGVEPGRELTVADVIELVHPDDRDAVLATHRAARHDHQPFVHQYRVIRPDGEVRVIESRGEVSAEHDGARLRMFGTARDVTDRKQTEAELRNVTTVLDASDDAITACLLDGVFVSWNRGAEKLYGHTAEEAIGQPPSLIVPPEEREALRANWDRILRGERVEALESRRLTKDGRRVVVATTLSPIIDASGEIIGVAAIGRDVTETKETEAALAAAHTKAVEASALKSQFMANMNHELRTPLNGVIGISSLLLETELSDEQAEYVDALRVSGDALMAVIEDILDFSKIEAGKLELEDEPFELRTVVEDVASMVAVGQPSRGVEVISSVDPTLPVNVWGDANRVRQILTNLTNNAVKFTEAGEVTINVSRRDETAEQAEVRFEVVDTGIGIEAAAQETIFESFAQADGSNTRRYGGTGLGLAIAKQLVALMGGEIGLQSIRGEGSTFWFRLPLRVAPSEPPPPPNPALLGVRVLVVDDKATNRGILDRELAGWGMTVQTAPDGPAALAALQGAQHSGDPFALVLLDFKMPGMNGGELAVAIKADPALSATTLVMMVAARDTRSASSIAELDGVATKPLRQARLYDEIVRVLGAGPGRSPDSVPAEPQQPTVATAAPRLLVAEDNVVNQLVAVRLLEKRGYRVDVAADGREAVEMHERTHYDAIFMDCQMPELDGYEATRAIRRREGDQRHTPIIAMTASTMPGDTDRCLAAGMDYYSGKPISQAGLDYVLAQALGSRVPGP
jgi:two-component system sensor histidine kinase/response regulator